MDTVLWRVFLYEVHTFFSFFSSSFLFYLFLLQSRLRNGNVNGKWSGTEFDAIWNETGSQILFDKKRKKIHAAPVNMSTDNLPAVL